jgi:polysaccharide pyruvyl transferase WcaK-like protein
VLLGDAIGFALGVAGILLRRVTSVRILFLASGFTYRTRNSKNLGDVAQQQATIERIRERFPSARILAVANSVNDLPSIPDLDMSYALIRYLMGTDRGRGKAKRLGAAFRAAKLLMNAQRIAIGRRPVFLSREGREVLEIIRNADAVVVSGAGAFNDTFGGSVAAVWALVLRIACALGKPAVVSGQQIGPFKKWTPKVITTWGLRYAQVIGVRDPISAETAVRIGLPSSRVVLTGDDAWFLKPCDSSEAMEILVRCGVVGSFIAAQVRFDKATNWKAEDSVALASVIDRISVLYEAPVLFLRTHYATDSDDLSAARAVQIHLSQPCHMLEEELSPSQTKGVISLARAGIGVSYHFCVFSCSSGTDTIGLYKSPYMNQKMIGLSALSPENIIAIGMGESNGFTAEMEKLERFVQWSKTHEHGQGPIKGKGNLFKSEAAIDMLVTLLS